MTKLKTLAWSEEREPCDSCSYHHAVAESALGQFSIEWKGWKEHDSRTVYIAGEHIGDSATLEDAKLVASQYIHKIVLALTDAVMSEQAQPEPTCQARGVCVRSGLYVAQPEQEPVAKYIGECNDGSLVQLYEDVKKGTPLYTAPPSREWVGLTDRKIDAVTKAQWGEMSSQPLAAHRAYARAVEAKLREKNT